MCLQFKISRPESVLEEGYRHDFEWAIIYNSMGYLCGYLKVEPGHPWYGLEYSDIDAIAHGDELNYSQPDVPCGGEGSEGVGPDSDNGWWVGFHCGGCFDLPRLEWASEGHREMVLIVRRIMKELGREITVDYVKGELNALASQAVLAKARQATTS